MIQHLVVLSINAGGGLLNGSLVGGHTMPSPERRFDAIIFNSPERFE